MRLLLLAFVLMPLASAAQTSATVASPDGRLAVTVMLDDAGPVAYQIDRDGAALLLPQRLGVVLAGGDTLGIGMRIMDTVTNSVDETWTQPWGEVAEVRDHHNELTVMLQETGELARRMDIVVRVFDNGVGLRYVWPEQPNLGAFEIMEELTGFHLVGNPQTWFIRAYEENRYEYLYEQMPLHRAGYLMHTPLTMAYGDVEGEGGGGPFVAIHEAALVDYAAMSLRRTGPQAFQAHLAPWSTGVAVYAEDHTPGRGVRGLGVDSHTGAPRGEMRLE
ncbi:MAG: glycoside hydrolase family 97 N-terminal domain-containing protein, partial [Bacteroidota bacterium]